MKIKIEVNKSKSKNNLFTAGNCHTKQKKSKIILFTARNCHSKQRGQNCFVYGRELPLKNWGGTGMQ